MSKVRVSLWVNGPPTDQQGTVHGILKKFDCADLAVEMDPETITYREVTSDELNPLWQINSKEIRMFSMDIDPTQLDYVLTAGCQPILDIGANATEVGTDEYDLAYASGGTFRNAGLTSIPTDWYVCGHTKYYVKTVVPDSLNNVTWNCYKPVGWTETSSQYSPISFDSAHPEKYYVTDAPAAVDVYFNSAAHFGIGAYNEAEVLGAYDSCSIRRFFGPNMYNWRPTYPTLSGASPGFWNAYWDLGNGYPGTRIFGAADLSDVLDGSYATRYKYYAFAHQYDPDDTGTPETYIGFLFTTENALGQITSASALIMSQDVASGVIRTPDGGEISGIEGGDGNWGAESDNDDNEDGDDSDNENREWLTGRSYFTPGYNCYLMWGPNEEAPFYEMLSNLWDPDVWEGFKNMYMNPIEGIVACYILPYRLMPPYSSPAESDYIYAAKAQLSETQAKKFNALCGGRLMGTFDVKEALGGSFADFANTSIYIHLPYVGTYQIDTAACMEGLISVYYQIDYYTADITAQITTVDRYGNQKIRYEWKGNCGVQIPLKQRVPISTNIANGLIKAAAPVAASGLAGLAAGTIQGLNTMANIYGATQGSMVDFETGKFMNGPYAGYSPGQVNNIAFEQGFNGGFSTGSNVVGSLMGSKVGSLATGINAGNGLASISGQSITSSNAHGGSVTSTIDTEIYLIIERPEWSNPAGYLEMFGLPSDIGGTINMSSTGDVSRNQPFRGFLSVRQVKLDGIEATTEEKAEIESLLRSGVYTSEFIDGTPDSY